MRGLGTDHVFSGTMRGKKKPESNGANRQTDKQTNRQTNMANSLEIFVSTYIK